MSFLAEGTELANKYRIVRVLGEGGMATVYEGEHIRLGQKVAIKILHADLLKEPLLIARFEREGRALSKLKSQNVVRVFDVDETLEGVPFLVMERLEGSDLDQEIAARGPLPIAEAVGYLSQACRAMAEAHELGVVHRDLKPSNLFLTTDGGMRIVKVLDFGIATDVLPEKAQRLTHTESVMGTPVYMAPEQFRRTRDVDGRADIWALGATLYEMLTGSPPFSGSPTTIGIAVVNDRYPPVEHARPDVPPELCAVLARTLEKDAAKRFSTMEELAEALLPFGDSVVVAPRASSRAFLAAADLERAPTHHAVVPVTAASAVEARAPVSAALPPLAPRRRSPLPWLGLAAVAATGAAVLFATRTPSVAPAQPAALVPSASTPLSATLSALTPLASVTPSVSRSAPPLPSAAARPSVPVGAPRSPTAPRPSASSSPAKPLSKPTASAAPPLFFPGQ